MSFVPICRHIQPSKRFMDKQTVYGWVSAKQIPVHKINKALAFLQSEIDDWLKSKVHKTQDDLMLEAEQFVKSKKIIR